MDLPLIGFSILQHTPFNKIWFQMEKEGKFYADQLDLFQYFFPNRGVEEEISRPQSNLGLPSI